MIDEAVACMNMLFAHTCYRFFFHTAFPAVSDKLSFASQFIISCKFPLTVTLAKGIGNGFPLAAVVTTPGESSLHESALQLSHYVYTSMYRDCRYDDQGTTLQHLRW